jgi:putative FmdB family regulatory protein
MPIYEYSCQKCGEHMEVMQKISDKPLVRHPKCGGRLVKEWSRTGFQFKGSGWYVTDYAGKKSDAKEDGKEAKATKETKTEAAESKSKDDKAADAKPAKTTKKAPSTGND